MVKSMKNPLPQPTTDEALNDCGPVNDEHPPVEDQIAAWQAKDGKVPGHYGADRLRKRAKKLETALTVLARMEFGEGPGHPFRGNQYTSGEGESDVGHMESISRFLDENPQRSGEDFFTWQGRIVQGLPEQMQSDVLFHCRETYEPCAYIADGINRWCSDHGLAGLPKDVNQTKVDLAEAHAVARYFETTPDQSGDPRVKAAYDDFKRQNDEMFAFMTKPESEGGLGIKVDFTNKVDPYDSAKAQADDLRENHHITIQSGLGGEHTGTMTTDEYDRFRAVHDTFGHAGIGGGFDRHGEWEAWLTHASMYTGPGRQAMSTEYHAVNTALWSGEKGTPGTGKSLLLPAQYAEPPWDRKAVAAAAVLSSDADAKALVKAMKLTPAFARTFDDLPLHPEVSRRPFGASASVELGDVPGHPFRGNQYRDGEGSEQSMGDWAKQFPENTVYRAMSETDLQRVRKEGTLTGGVNERRSPRWQSGEVWASNAPSNAYLDPGEVIVAVERKEGDVIGGGFGGDLKLRPVPASQIIGVWHPPKARAASALDGTWAPPWEFGDLPGHDFRGNQYVQGDAVDVYNPHDFPQATLSAFDPKMQAKIVSYTEEKTGVSYAEGKENLSTLLDEARGTPTWDAGLTWYARERSEADEIAKRCEIPLDNVVGAFAAMSPGQTWDYEKPIVTAMAEYQHNGVVDLSQERLDKLNAALERKGLDPISNGTKFADIPSFPAVMTMKQQFDEDKRGAWGVGYSYLNFDKGLRVMRDEDPDKVLGGVKIRSFYNNLMDPTSARDTTVDVHMLAAYAADPSLHNDSSIMGAPSMTTKDVGKTEIGPTPLIADAVRDIATANGILPQQAQAIIWEQWRQDFTRYEKR
jgi:hypothetical protein